MDPVGPVERGTAVVAAYEVVVDQRPHDRFRWHAVKGFAYGTHELRAPASDDEDTELSSAQLVEEFEHGLVDG